MEWNVVCNLIQLENNICVNSLFVQYLFIFFNYMTMVCKETNVFLPVSSTRDENNVFEKL